MVVAKATVIPTIRSKIAASLNVRYNPSDGQKNVFLLGKLSNQFIPTIKSISPFNEVLYFGWLEASL